MPDHDAKDRSARAPATVTPFQIRGRFLTAIALRLEGDPTQAALVDARDQQLKRGFQLMFTQGAPAPR